MRQPKPVNKEIGKKICQQIAQGHSLVKILALHAKDEAYPCYSHFMRWLARSSWLRETYTQARVMQSHYLVDECLAIANETSQDVVVGLKGPLPNHAAVARAELQIKTRRWLASLHCPLVFSERRKVALQALVADQPADRQASLVVKAVAAGQLSPQEGKAWLGLIQQSQQVTYECQTRVDIEERLQQLEQQAKGVE